MLDNQQHSYLSITRKKQPTKFLIVGTVALTAAVIASLCLYQNSGATSSINFNMADASEKEQAFMHFIAKYGKTYASRSDINTRFQVFSQNYDAM